MLTICIPYYENEILLRKAVDSVLKQSLSSWRLNISLDSDLSEDFTHYLFSLGDDRIQVFRNKEEDKGICGNWNNCIDAVDSEFMTILHSDDELEPNYITTMLKLISSAPDNALYFCNAKIIDIKSQITFSFVDKIKAFIRPNLSLVKLHGDKGLANLLKGCFIFCPSICYNSKVLKSYKFRPQWQMVLDLDLYTRLLIDKHTLCGTNSKSYRYRRHDNNQTAKLTKDFKRFNEEILLYEDITRQAKKLGWQTTERVARDKIIIKLHLAYLITKSFLLFDWKRTALVFNYYYKHIVKNRFN